MRTHLPLALALAAVGALAPSLGCTMIVHDHRTAKVVPTRAVAVTSGGCAGVTPVQQTVAVAFVQPTTAVAAVQPTTAVAVVQPTTAVAVVEPTAAAAVVQPTTDRVIVPEVAYPSGASRSGPY
jgi:hypothetical protein